MAGFYKMVITLFIFISIVYPLKDFNNDFSKLETSISDEDFESGREKSIEAMINNQIISILKNKKIKTISVLSNVIIVDDSISVNSVSIAVSDEYDLDEVKEIVFDELGINAEVHHIGN